jgi:hypothetical protein
MFRISKLLNQAYVQSGSNSRAVMNSSPVDKKIEHRLTGPVNHGVLFKVNCFAQNPSAAMRGGFLRRGWWTRSAYKRSDVRED